MNQQSHTMVPPIVGLELNSPANWLAGKM